jgi:20S proteasome alpha/beta subunit
MELDEETRKDLKKSIVKTGTTTLGIVCKDSIVLAADKRATYGGEGGVSYIADKDIEKVCRVGENVVVTTAGVASDTQKVIKYTNAELRLKEIRTKRKPNVKEAASLFSSIVYQNIRQFSPIMAITHFLLAGFDDKGYYLYDITPDGLLKEIDTYSATGSGMINCIPILDSEYKKGISTEEGIKLAKKCISASISRDPASGEGIDLFIITKNSIVQSIKEKAVIEFKEI